MIMVDDSAKMVVAEWVADHCNATGHSVYMDNLKVLDREKTGLDEAQGVGGRPSTSSREHLP